MINMWRHMSQIILNGHWALELQVRYPTKAFKPDLRQSSRLTLPTSDACYVHVCSTFPTMCRRVLSGLVMPRNLTGVQWKLVVFGVASVKARLTVNFMWGIAVVYLTLWIERPSRPDVIGLVLSSQPNYSVDLSFEI